MNKQKLTVGELVVIRDYSCAGRVGPDGQMTYNGNCEPYCGQQFKVSIVGCKIPTYIFLGEYRIADTVIVGQKDHSVWFVHSNLVRRVLPEHAITIDGKTVKISHESFLSLKKQLI